MKRISIIISTFCLTMIYGQKVSDYTYVSVPEKFTSFKDDYGLEAFLKKSLKGKKYVIIPGDKRDWPSEVKDNLCSVINADVLNDSGLLRNKVLLQFKDCNDKVILSAKGSSNIKEFVAGYNEALQQSLIAVPASNPIDMGNVTAQPTTVSEVKEVVASTPVSTVSSTTATSASSAEKKAERYSNGKLDLQRIQIDANQFILADSNSSVPFATFKATTKKDVFRVKLANGDSTIGYFEGRNVVIELPQANGEYSKEVFSGK
ncbi:hypothetical protein MUU74_02045 [Chryseobacterium daecheongense]|uniref:hypothetical protein n=1 Tax=Chryseobacterium daecheongense TaxID=192389 RepID=UPI001FD64FD8|nr:hypothetical protein [Chryseobacterium daecheongense]UOU98750.1 hypothetical protein MUU74_02045 [Chryseobacterium daecheongense]